MRSIKLAKIIRVAIQFSRVLLIYIFYSSCIVIGKIFGFNEAVNI